MTSRVGTIVHVVTCLAFAWSAALLAGCSTSSERRVRNPQPREDLEPVQIQLTVGLPYDSDGNGYPDTVQSLVYVFPDSRESALPIRVKGTFEFAMQNAAGDVVAHWVFPPDVTDQAARFLPAGIGYSMYLRLAPGQDVMGPTSLDVRCRFVTVDGVEVRGQGRASVRFGG